MITEDLKTRILAASNITEVIEDYVTLKRSGKNFVGICPFHADKSPSFFVSPSKQTCKCFSCGEGGDVIYFIQKHEHLTFPEALKMLAKRAHIDYDETADLTPEEDQKRRERESLQIAIEAATKYFQDNLINAKSYLESRGYDVSDEVLKIFRLGYACEGNTLLRDLAKAGYNKDLLTKVDVIKMGDNGNYYDTFRDRIIFPFLDLSGRPIGFSGRIQKVKENTGKYLNSSDTPLFNKGRAVFGLFQARAEISRKDNAFLVEGQFDVMTFYREGILNTIAGSGTALTTDQIKLIARFTKNVTTIYDADPAGVKASLKNCKTLLHEGLNVRCIKLPAGKDPDNLANEKQGDTEMWLINNTTDFVNYFLSVLPFPKEDPIASKETYNAIADLIAEVSEESLRNQYCQKLSVAFNENDDLSIVKKKVREIRRKFPKTLDIMVPGVYGLEQIKETLPENQSVTLTSNFEKFISEYSELPTVYIHGRLTINHIQSLRSAAVSFTTSNEGLKLKNGVESDYLASLTDCYKNGVTELRVVDDFEYDVEDEINGHKATELVYSFVTFFLELYRKQITVNIIDRANLIEKCVELISYASDSERIVNSKTFAKSLDLTEKQYSDILKPFLDKRKSRQAIKSRGSEDEGIVDYDPDVLPDYVEENKEYKAMYQTYGYYPLINSKGKPVAYMFKNPKGGHTLVGDFYMEPLLHIEDEDPERNKRIFQIFRRHYPNSFYMEFKSKSLIKRSSMEEVIILKEAMNFDNGTDDHWIHIKSCMSRRYRTCSQINIYGQQTEGFYAFSNAIYHEDDNGHPEIILVDDLGVATHNAKNYYLPAFSKIYSESRKDDDKFEALRYFKHVEIPAEKQCSFDKWASLMDTVYKINDNGKWALIYSIMCAFRSDIHAMDRLFTALFFMGPVQSGKTQIAISVRSLFVNPEMGLFNLCTGSDAAFSALMGSFRDVPVVLDEFNNKDISDTKFQGLKSITYDGDGRQKRKGTAGKEIETDKIYAPVVILGQETPQRDDNSLISRVIVCEVAKKGLFTEAEANLFKELKDFEKRGLSNILFEILKLRPLVHKHFYAMKKEISKELSDKILLTSNASGDMVRLINTVSLLLTMCKLIMTHAPHLKLPFTYNDFFELASKKVISQVELISHSDKLATFFKAIDVMINTKTILQGRDFDIAEPQKLTVKLSGSENKELVLPNGSKVLFLRISVIYTQFARSSFNPEQSSQTTIEQNLRSCPAYIGAINARRFKWMEVAEVPAGDQKEPDELGTPKNMTMIKVMKQRDTMGSCIALDYRTFKSLYDIDFERDEKIGDSGEVNVPF